MFEIGADPVVPGAVKEPQYEPDPEIEEEMRKILPNVSEIDYDPQVHGLPYVRQYAPQVYHNVRQRAEKEVRERKLKKQLKMAENFLQMGRADDYFSRYGIM